MKMKLYTYFRSSAAYRVRIALNLKALPYEAVPVHLLKNGGEQLLPSYRKINPNALLPALDDDGTTMTQSLAIIEYLEEKHPQVALLPPKASDRARVRALALMIACDIHPLSNLRVLNYLVGTLGISEETKLEWIRHWIKDGFAAIEANLTNYAQPGIYCYGNEVTIADCCLIPQVFNAIRFAVDLNPYPRINAIYSACVALPAFILAHPSQQPDAE